MIRPPKSVLLQYIYDYGLDKAASLFHIDIETADKIMKTLSSPAYRAEVGTNGNFILMHSVGSIPHGAEIDVPLNYADYYFLEGIMRKRDLEK